MTKTRERTWLLVAMLFAACVVAIVFPSIISGPGYIVTYPDGDSGKNIFTYLYHILYDKGLWFTGMNYPYGEHIVYTDGQPLLSVALSYFKSITTTQALIVMGCAIVVSYFLAIVYVYKILYHFGVRPLIAMVFSGLIICMSPQLFRTMGHFGLSYACVLPMVFYWTICYRDSGKWKYPAFIFILGFIATFLHPYQSALILIWSAFYSTGHFIFTKATVKTKLKHLLPYIGSVVVLLAVTGLIIKFTDPYTDRPVTPFGFLVYTTRISHIFASHFSPLWNIVERNRGFTVNRSGEEGFTYLGVTVIFTLFAFAAYSIIKLFTGTKEQKDEQLQTGVHRFEPIWLFIAFSALLLAMGVPFIWKMEWLLKYLSFMRQFRTLGRFSWIFYYIVTIYGVLLIHNFYAANIARGRRVIAYSALLLALGLWGYEASGHVARERKATEISQNYHYLFNGTWGRNWKNFMKDHKRQASEFQALLMLRFSHVGTDKLWLGGDMNGRQIPPALEIGVQLHLPLVDAMMARSSWSIAQKQVKIAAGPYVYKPMLDDLPDNRPFLLVNAEYDTLDADQSYLLSASDSIGQYHEWKVYACYPDRIKTNDKRHVDSIKALLPSLPVGDTCIRNTGSWYVDHFNSGTAKEAFFGKGAIPQIHEEDIPLADIQIRAGYDAQEYELSCWFLLNRKDYKNPNIEIALFNSAGDTLARRFVYTRESTDSKGLWFRALLHFPMPLSCTRAVCTLKNTDRDSYEIMDELMLRPANALIISKGADGEVMVNNHLLPR